MDELIEELGRTHTRLTDQIISTPKGNPNKKKLRELRTKLEDKMEEVMRINADQATQQFIDANNKLLEVNKKVQEELDELGDMQAKIDAVRSLIGSITEFLNIFP